MERVRQAAVERAERWTAGQAARLSGAAGHVSESPRQSDCAAIRCRSCGERRGASVRAADRNLYYGTGTIPRRPPGIFGRSRVAFWRGGGGTIDLFTTT